MDQKNILILGAGNSQVDAIDYCHAHGHKVIGCSYTNKDCGIPLLDYFEQVDIKDFDGVARLAAKCGADLVYSVGSDLAVPTAMKVSADLGLPHFITYEAAETCHAKHRLREALGPGFEGNVRYLVCSTLRDALAYDSFPGMMKPVDSQGQRGCFRVDSAEDIRKHFDTSLDYSIEGKVIIEEFVTGKEISVNAYRQNGVTKLSVVSDRVVFDEYPGGLVRKHRIPSRYADAAQQAAAIDLVNRIADRVGLTDGPVYCQIKLGSDGKPYVLEVAPRLDGCHMWNLIRHCCGADLLDACFRQLLFGEEVLTGTYELPAEDHELEFLCEVTGAPFDPDRYDLSDALFSRMYYDKGDSVGRVNGYYEKCGYVIRKIDKGE